MKEYNKSVKLEHVAYDIRGPVLEEANAHAGKRGENPSLKYRKSG